MFDIALLQHQKKHNYIEEQINKIKRPVWE